MLITEFQWEFAFKFWNRNVRNVCWNWRIAKFLLFFCPKQNEVYLILFFSAVVVQNTTNSPSIYGKYSVRIRSIVEVNITYETIMNKLVTTIIKAIINNTLTISYNKQIRQRSQKWLERWRAQVQVPSGWICFR